MSTIKEMIKKNTPRSFRILYARCRNFRFKRFKKRFLLKVKKALLYRNASSNNWVYKMVAKLFYKQSNFVCLLGIEELEKKYSSKITAKNNIETNLLCSKIKVFEEEDLKNTLSVKSSSSYSLILSDVIVFGESNLILVDDNHGFYDLKNIENDNIAITDSIFFSENNSIYLYENIRKEIKVDEGINLLVNYSFNYYHFLFEALVKFKFLKDINSNVPLLVDEIVERTPQFKELLDLFNTKRDVIFVKKHAKVNVKKLHHIGLLNVIPPNFKNNSKIELDHVLFERDSLRFIRTKLLNNLPKVAAYKKIYLSRKGASGRRKFNEDEISNLLMDKGFEVIAPQDYSILEQISLFNNADVIIGGSGAAFTNLIFCNENAKVFVLSKSTLRKLNIFSTIAEYVGCDLKYIMEEESNDINQNIDLHEDFEINVNQILRAIS